MGCCGDREKGVIVAEEQKWDYINLSDFRSTSCLTPLSYVWLWILVLVSCAVYAADAFTAVNLLAYNKWSSQVQPKVSFEVAKWIFAITIIISYVFLIYRGFRTLRVMRSGSVTECYLEPIAAIWQSMRVTNRGQGWRRFLVFAELTKSKKGVNYIALFVYFQFKSALIVVVAQGPRIAINAMTLYAVMKAELLPVGHHASEEHSNFEQFFLNIGVLIDTGNRQETIIYFTMLFSLVIWVFAALGLLISVLLYMFFLWHYIPRSDGSLTQYCRRKLETRLGRIVGKKMKKAIEKENQLRKEAERRAKKKGDLGSTRTVPTLPKLDGEDDISSVYTTFQQSNTTLPLYSSNPPSRTNTMNTTSTARTLAMQPSLPSLSERPDLPTRHDTQFSNFSSRSYSSNAPLINEASGMGTSTPAPPMPTLTREGDYFGEPPAQPFSVMAQGRASPRPPRGPPLDTSYTYDHYSTDQQLITPPYHDPQSAQSTQPYQEYSPFNSRAPPPLNQAYKPSPVDASPYYSHSNTPVDYAPPQLPSTLRTGTPVTSQPRGMPPPRSGTAPPRQGLPSSLQSATQRRDAPQPFPNRGMSASAPAQQRSATAPGWAPQPAQKSYTPSSQRNYHNGYDY
ncbi:hypothetical protein P153DRAFT_327583 [Dothidotthia symphoricarpi CBS 119687]|uniref:Pheromone-regulated membrane protein n=1 Tax=Dothidotthia symphoricarpi CBS 119687 TaxID=1392245 RepID=A0A6A5ZX59_9PLEO|nr:uncharacterized protein P153DRAFT_327583 [Dothidotthia symphoricarpi CBS 119687]KAF2123886.1 hypothetical protein P153DRAFT_327583 [Dothidotthia symphoricarpi CBS 119687]